MAKTPKPLDEFLKPMRGQDLPTLRAPDHKLHLLLRQRLGDKRPTNGNAATREEISAQGASVKIDAELLALVGIHPQSPVEEGKAIIREIIAQRFSD